MAIVLKMLQKLVGLLALTNLLTLGIYSELGKIFPEYYSDDEFKPRYPPLNLVAISAGL